jgi:peroxiredoxin
MRRSVWEISVHVSRVGSLMKFCLIVCLALGTQCLTWAQAAEVSINQLELTHKTEGWMVTQPGFRYAQLRQNDLIVALDGSPAAAMGPLTLVNFFNESFSRPVHVAIKRGNTIANIQLRSEEDSNGPLKSRLVAAIGFRAPEFKTHDLSGKRVSLSEFGSRWVLLAFGATWCPECLAEITHLRRLHEEYPNDLAIVMLALDDKGEKLRALAAREQIEYPVVNLGGFLSPVPIEYGVSSPKGNGELPTDFLIRPDRSIAYVQVGASPRLRIYEQVKAIMEQSHK